MLKIMFNFSLPSKKFEVLSEKLGHEFRFFSKIDPEERLEQLSLKKK